MALGAALIIDVREWSKLPDRGDSLRRRVFVDGIEISGVWYVDTVAKLVKTYHIFQDADEKVLQRVTDWWLRDVARKESQSDLRRQTFAYQDELLKLIPVGWEIEAEPEEAISRTIRGKVELRPIEDETSKSE
jgi:hypothetical protein